MSKGKLTKCRFDSGGLGWTRTWSQVVWRSQVTFDEQVPGQLLSQLHRQGSPAVWGQFLVHPLVLVKLPGSPTTLGTRQGQELSRLFQLESGWLPPSTSTQGLGHSSPLFNLSPHTATSSINGLWAFSLSPLDSFFIQQKLWANVSLVMSL